jgi:hypothetical protein
LIAFYDVSRRDEGIDLPAEGLEAGRCVVGAGQPPMLPALRLRARRAAQPLDALAEPAQVVLLT